MLIIMLIYLHINNAARYTEGISVLRAFRGGIWGKIMRGNWLIRLRKTQ